MHEFGFNYQLSRIRLSLKRSMLVSQTSFFHERVNVAFLYELRDRKQYFRLIEKAIED